MDLKTLLQSAALGEEDDEEEDEDFREEDCSSGSESEEQSVEDPAVAASESVGASAVKAVAARYAELKESSRPKKALSETEVFPACQVKVAGGGGWPAEDIQTRVSKFVSSQPASKVDCQWRERGANLVSLTNVRSIMTEMESELKNVRVRRMRFAGKVYDIEVDPTTNCQKLTTSADDQALQDIQDTLKRAEDVSAMTKSRADWMNYIKTNEDVSKFKQHRKSGSNILRKKAFLQNVAVAAESSAPRRRRRFAGAGGV